MKKSSYAISGMTCAACARSIERAVKKVEGVSEVSVNLATESLALCLNRVSEQQVMIAVEKAGFKLLVNQKSEKEQQKKSKQLLKEFIISACFTTALLYVAMGSMIALPLPLFFDSHSHPLNFAYLQFFLLIPSLWAGRHFYSRGLIAVSRRAANMDSLVAMGSSAAIIYSGFSILQYQRGYDAMLHQLYFETAAVIITLILLGKLLENRAKGKTTEAIKKLMALKPEGAMVLSSEGRLVFKAIDIIEIGDLIKILPGERLALDGVVVEGESYIDESMISGESLPVTKKKGDKVVGGSINSTGSLLFKVTAVGNETLLSRIITMVLEAQGSKAPIAALADKVSSIFVPVVFIIAILSSFAWLVAGKDFAFAFTVFVAVLTIACPCALGLATPVSIMVGIGKGAEHGILIKDGAALEMAYHIDSLVFDKTGTITTGRGELTDIISWGGYDEQELLIFAASVEQYSQHPFAHAISTRAQGVPLKISSMFESQSGLGVSAMVEGKSIVMGNEMQISSIVDGKQKIMLREQAMMLALSGKSPFFMAIDGKIEAIFAFADQEKESSKEAISRLKELGITLYMMSGDHASTAMNMAKKVGIEHVMAGLLPQDKAALIKKMQDKNLLVGMVGDGVNDAPALAVSDLSIAMGSGSDIAMDSAGITLLKSDLADVERAITLSRLTIRNIKQNLFWAFGYNVLTIPIACGVLYLFGGPLLNPMLAAAAMSFSSVSVVLNALRLKKIEL